jgi:HAD superfamily hydrolase (TIGR01549 family)
MVRSFVAGAADFGVIITPKRALTLMKENLRYCCDVIGAEHGIASDALIAAFRRHEQDELNQGLPPVAGIPETLEALHAYGIKHYVATHRDLQCRELLEKAGLLKYFSGFVTQEDGLPRKPAPDMLLHLMRKHGLKPEECMMVGDRPLDTEAGMAARVLSVLLDVEDRFPDGKCDIRIAAPWLLSNYIT